MKTELRSLLLECSYELIGEVWCASAQSCQNRHAKRQGVNITDVSIVKSIRHELRLTSHIPDVMLI
jgi:hypothetical protein